MSAASALFRELIWNFDHEGWNDYALPKLKLKEIQFLCMMMCAPKSGTKEKISIRLLAIRQVRTKIAKYALEELEQLVADYPKEALKWMAKEAGLWRSGNKRQLATVLLNWREKCRHDGQAFFDQQRQLAQGSLRQLTLFPQ